uniref:Titin-like n=1 Tax=Stomoxys calcitrans TaxID=35570 RepID=A0A1I8QAV4_STOCA
MTETSVLSSDIKAVVDLSKSRYGHMILECSQPFFVTIYHLLPKVCKFITYVVLFAYPFSERRFSAYQLEALDSTDEDSSSGREDSYPPSPNGYPQQQPPQFGPYLGVNGQVPHESRSRTKTKKPRSKSLQPQSNIVPWRKASRPLRGRSLGKSPFLPGFKPEPIKSWTEEQIDLKPAQIEKKVIPKTEVAKVVLKSIKSQRDQGLLSLGATLDKIIEGKTDNEAIPWITMRDKLRQVETVQRQLEKFELDEVYLRDFELPIVTDAQQPQQATHEQVQRDREIQRLKSMESIEINEMTQEMEKLLDKQYKMPRVKGEDIPWQEMRKYLKKVQREHKQIEKFKIEEVDLHHLTAEELIAHQANLEAAQAAGVMWIDDDTRAAVQRYIQQRDEMQKMVEIQDIQKQHFTSTEQSSTFIEQTMRTQIDERTKMTQHHITQDITQQQQYVSVEDTKLMSFEQREHQRLTRLAKEQQSMHWRHPREPQQFVQVEDAQFLSLQERQDTEEQSLIQPQPVMWERGKKKPQQPVPKTYEELHDELVEGVPQTPKPEELVPVMWERGKKKTQQVTQLQQTQQSTKTYEEAVDQLVEEQKSQPVEQLQPVMWERGKKKPKPQQQQPVEQQQPQKGYEEAVDVLPEEPKLQEQPQPVMWERGKKKAAKQPQEQPIKTYEEAVDELPEEPKTQETPQPVMWERGKKKKQQELSEITQVTEEKVLEEKVVEEVKKKTTIKAIPQQPEEKIGQMQLKPTPRPKPKEKPTKEEIHLKPVKRTQTATTEDIQEQPQKSYEEATDELVEEPQPQQPEELKPVLWERGKKKKPQKLQKPAVEE